MREDEKEVWANIGKMQKCNARGREKSKESKKPFAEEEKEKEKEKWG